MERHSTHPIRLIVASISAACLLLAMGGGCPGGAGNPLDLFGGGSNTNSNANDNTSGGAPAFDQSDPAGASAIIEREAGTVTMVESDDGTLVQAVDADRNVHEFLIFESDAGDLFLGEYRMETDDGALTIAAAADGALQQLVIEDYASGTDYQLAFQWSDATHALVNMTQSDKSGTTAFEIEAPEAEAARRAAKAARKAGRLDAAAKPSAPRAAAPTDEQRLSLPVKIACTDSSGNPVSNLNTAFRLRALYGNTTFGAARGRELSRGTYSALLPAYVSVARRDYGSYRPYLDTATKIVDVAAAIAPFTPLPPITAVAGGILWVATNSTVLVADGIFGTEFTDAPTPTALGQQVEDFEVRVSLGDRKNTTVIKSLTYDELYETYVYPRAFLDLGTVVVERSFEPKPPGYRLYLLPQIGPGQLEVLSENAPSENIPLCTFAGGGTDCSVIVQLQTYGEIFATKEEAVSSICGQARSLRILPLGVGPAVELTSGTTYFTSYEVYDLLGACPGL